MIRVERISIDDIPQNWPWLAQLLSPAIRVDGKRRIEAVHAGLLKGELGIATVHAPMSAGLVVVEPVDGALWLSYIAGRSLAGPKALVRLLRELMAHFETKAREAGCTELRIGGRDYSRFFPDFEPFDGAPNGLRKVIV